MPTKYKVEVQTDSTNQWYSNTVTYDTYEEAFAAARNLADRWFLVRNYRAVPVDASAATQTPEVLL